MVEVTDKLGQKVYVTTIPDCEDNEGGFYCETYADETFGAKIDDFCIHIGDCEFTDEGIENYIKNYYKDTKLDLDYNF